MPPPEPQIHLPTNLNGELNKPVFGVITFAPVSPISEEVRKRGFRITTKDGSITSFKATLLDYVEFRVDQVPEMWVLPTTGMDCAGFRRWLKNLYPGITPDVLLALYCFKKKQTTTPAKPETGQQQKLL